MKKLTFYKTTILLIFFAANLAAQNKIDTLLISKIEAEAVFIEQNIALVAKQLNIKKAEAQLIQARLWPNPTLTLEEVNFWDTNSTEHAGHYGSIQIEQTLPLGGKRRHAIAMHSTLASIAEMSFENALRKLKFDFRNLLIELHYLQQYSIVFSSQLHSINTLVSAFENQLQQGNISRAEVVRLKALELEVLNNSNEISIKKNQIQQELKLFMNLPANALIKLNDQDFIPNIKSLKALNIENLIETAKNRADIKLKSLENNFYQSQLDYEKAQRIPDIDVAAFYDFGKNPMFDFVGIGVSFDLPILNRNRGAIAAAEIELDKAQLQQNFKQNEVLNEIVTAYQNLKHHINFYKQIDSSYEETLDSLLNSYTHNFRQRNINLLEYLDFVETYIENKNILLTATKNVLKSTEKLNYATGIDLTYD